MTVRYGIILRFETPHHSAPRVPGALYLGAYMTLIVLASDAELIKHYLTSTHRQQLAAVQCPTNSGTAVASTYLSAMMHPLAKRMYM
jgi:hypothetical protein